METNKDTKNYYSTSSKSRATKGSLEYMCRHQVLRCRGSVKIMGRERVRVRERNGKTTPQVVSLGGGARLEEILHYT
jgi:hypothetical protein